MTWRQERAEGNSMIANPEHYYNLGWGLVWDAVTQSYDT